MITIIMDVDNYHHGVTTKNLKKVEAGKGLGESTRKKREAKKQAKLEASEVNQYYKIGAVIALG